MKKLLFLLSTILIFSSLKAQEAHKVKPGQILPKDKSTNEMYRYYKSPHFRGPLTNIELDSTFQLHDITAFQPKAKFLYDTEMGSVYALPLDNMPCLRPKVESHMPIARLSPNGYIPNALHDLPRLNGKINKMQIIPPKKK